MASFNRIIIMGNLTRDPEFKSVASNSLCRLSLASNRQFRSKQTGTLVQEVCYVDIEVWGAQAESCHQHLQKGRAILVEGRLKLDTWKEADGQTRRRHYIVSDKVVFVGGSQQSDSLPAEENINQGALAQKPSYGQVAQQQSSQASSFGDDLNSEMLFKDEPPFEEDLPF